MPKEQADTLVRAGQAQWLDDTTTLPMHAEVVGLPVPQGSKRIVPTGAGPRLIDVNDAKLKDWRHLVGTQAASVAAPTNATIARRGEIPLGRIRQMTSSVAATSPRR